MQVFSEIRSVKKVNDYNMRRSMSIYVMCKHDWCDSVWGQHKLRKLYCSFYTLSHKFSTSAKSNIKLIRVSTWEDWTQRCDCCHAMSCPRVPMQHPSTKEDGVRRSDNQTWVITMAQQIRHPIAQYRKKLRLLLQLPDQFIRNGRSTPRLKRYLQRMGCSIRKISSGPIRAEKITIEDIFFLERNQQQVTILRFRAHRHGADTEHKMCISHSVKP